MSFAFGLIEKNKRFHDTARGKLTKARLTTEWQTFTIDLSAKDPSRVVTGFVCIIAGTGMPNHLCLDDIRFE